MMSWGGCVLKCVSTNTLSCLWVLISKRAGIPKGWRLLWLWVSNRGKKHPVGWGIQRGQRTLGGGFQRRQSCLGRKNPMKPAVSWHTTLLEKSSVLYLWRPWVAERGCSGQEQTLSVSHRTGGFCVLPDEKPRSMPKAESACSGVGGAAKWRGEA